MIGADGFILNHILRIAMIILLNILKRTRLKVFSHHQYHAILALYMLWIISYILHSKHPAKIQTFSGGNQTHRHSTARRHWLDPPPVCIQVIEFYIPSWPGYFTSKLWNRQIENV